MDLSGRQASDGSRVRARRIEGTQITSNKETIDKLLIKEVIIEQ